MGLQLKQRAQQAYHAFRIDPASPQAAFIKQAIVDAIKTGTVMPGSTPPIDNALEGTTSHPHYEHWTCGTGHIRAQRALRIIERAAHYGLTDELVEQITDLVDQAGPADCREALAVKLDEVPF